MLNKYQELKKQYDKIARANLEIGQRNCRLNELVDKQLNDLTKLDTFVAIIKEKRWLVEDILNAFIEDKDKYNLLKEVLL